MIAQTKIVDNKIIEKKLALIQQNPFVYPIIYNNVHRKLLPKFPFGLFYVIQDDIIFILACFHVKRDPQQCKRHF